MPGGVPVVGTVVKHWVQSDDLPNDMEVAPYGVRLDDGRFCLVSDHEDQIRRSDAPPLKVVHNTGSRVEVKVPGEEDEWVPGTVYSTHTDWVERDFQPYAILLDDGSEIPFWGPQDCIRASSIPAPEKRCSDLPSLRFKLGERVSCFVGGSDGWLDGTVIEQWYGQEADFENDHVVPYQIQLDIGQQIYAPADDDECIKRSDAPPPSCWICYENEQSEDNLIVRECACRGEHNGFVHVKCLVKMVQKRVEDNDPPSDEVSPFVQCITCKAPFGGGRQCSSALTKAFYDAYKDRDIDDFWNKVATTEYIQLLVRGKKYGQASALLSDRISKIRLEVEAASANENVALWKRDLANFLLDLAEMYEAMGRLSEMKATVDESRSIIDDDDVGEISYGTKSTALQLLANHAYATGDKNTALGYLEELVTLAKASSDEMTDLILAHVLIRCGNLNLDCGNKERGLEQLSAGLDTLSTIYGRNHVRRAKNSVRKVGRGEMDKLPSKGLMVMML